MSGSKKNMIAGINKYKRSFCQEIWGRLCQEGVRAEYLEYKNEPGIIWLNQDFSFAAFHVRTLWFPPKDILPPLACVAFNNFQKPFSWAMYRRLFLDNFDTTPSRCKIDKAVVSNIQSRKSTHPSYRSRIICGMDELFLNYVTDTITEVALLYAMGRDVQETTKMELGFELPEYVINISASRRRRAKQRERRKKQKQLAIDPSSRERGEITGCYPTIGDLQLVYTRKADDVRKRSPTVTVCKGSDFGSLLNQIAEFRR